MTIIKGEESQLYFEVQGLINERLEQINHQKYELQARRETSKPIDKRKRGSTVSRFLQN